MPANIFSKIKSYFKEPEMENKPGKEFLNQVFQNYLKIKKEFQVSDIKINGGINFKVSYQGSIVPFWLVAGEGITQEVAEFKIQDTLTKIAVGLALGLNLVEISQALKELAQ